MANTRKNKGQLKSTTYNRKKSNYEKLTHISQIGKSATAHPFTTSGKGDMESAEKRAL
jgi:hypothetical protein